MEEGHRFCMLECLEKRIQSDFSASEEPDLSSSEERHSVTVLYGISGDSALPFASSAVVQLPSSPAQFILAYIPNSQHHCFSDYIYEYCVDKFEGSRTENGGCKNQAEVSAEIPSHETATLDYSKPTQYQYFSNGRTSPFGLGSQNSTCKFSGRYSCFRTITALAPTARLGIASYELFQGIASEFSSGALEDHVLHSLCLLIEGKPAGRDAANFFSLLGVPSFSGITFPGCVRHPNIAPILGMLRTSSHVSLVHAKTPYTLENILYYSPGAFKSDWHIRFLVYQLLSALSYMHGMGVTHGNVRPSSIMLTDLSWCLLHIDDVDVPSPKLNSKVETCYSSMGRNCSSKGCMSQGLFSDSKLYQPMDWQSSFYKWYNGELSNFEYLLILNKLAGRRWGDHTFYTVMPWVVDFSVKPDENIVLGWRDLSKSKWRLAKGDEQLDFTYSTSEIPHHISDECLSELAVCSYKARRLPLDVLKMAVRSVYEPNEYPSTMQRLYQWTPDECIPEFYCDPRIFYSMHSGMSDLSVPPWARSPEEFIKLHRDAFESDLVSSQLHLWIDITFGYKMSGHAAIDAKNVMLPPAASSVLRSAGRRQLFSKPHPARKCLTRTNNDLVAHHCQVSDTTLHHLEEAASFCDHVEHLSPVYDFHYDHLDGSSNLEEHQTKISPNRATHEIYCGVKSIIDAKYLIENIEVDDDNVSYQELLIWEQKCSSKDISKDVASDIFAVGCLLAELYLNRPLFNPNTLTTYLESGALPSLIKHLPPQIEVLVRTCIQKEWKRTPSVKCLLESPFFPGTVKSSYLFLAPLQLVGKDESRLRYVANFAKQGALRVMGSFAAEVCASHCLPLVQTTLSDTEAEWAYMLLSELVKCLTPEAIKNLVLPAIQKILQATTYSRLKVSLLQGSFVLDIWNRVGKQVYLEVIHPAVLSNLFASSNKSSAAAASVLLVGSCEELGVPITVYQIILPLIHCLGKGLCDDGIETVVRIGCLLGENFIVKHILPLLKNLVRSCINNSSADKPELIQSSITLALINCLTILDGLVAHLSKEAIIKELVTDGGCLYVDIIMHTNVGASVLQAAATRFLAACEQIGPEFTELHVLPKLKVLFDELAYSQESFSVSSMSVGPPKRSIIKMHEEDCNRNHMDLVLFLYPSFASLLGIQKLRQGCATWLLLEQLLLRRYNWKWEHSGESSQSSIETANSRRSSFSKSGTSEYVPARMLLNGVGWSTPQRQGKKVSRNLILQKPLADRHQTSDTRDAGRSDIGKYEPWSWFPGPSSSSEGLDFFGRASGPKDEFPWKIRASVVHSVRAHHGALRSFAVCEDECTVFTAGVGQGFKGTVQKWELSRVDCVSGYHGHEEVVNDICILTSLGRVASCDGTVHVWNSQTGKIISIFSEFSTNSAHFVNSLRPSKADREEDDALHYHPLSVGVLNNAFDGSFYTCMHFSQASDMLIVGAGNGSIRFIDINRGQKLHLWRSNESNFPSLVSSICSSGSSKVQAEGAPSWIAAGLSSGHCTLFDARSGNIISSWQAHDGYVTELAAPNDHLLVSSSLDRTLRIWDLRRSSEKSMSEPITFKGHMDGVSGFSIWGQDVISIARNRIGLSSLTRPSEEWQQDGENLIMPQHLYMADGGESKNMSSLSSISILPFSRLFLVGTEDGYLKICC